MGMHSKKESSQKTTSHQSNRLGKREGTQRPGPASPKPNGASSRRPVLHDRGPCFASTPPAQAPTIEHTVKLNHFFVLGALLACLNPSPHRQTHQDYYPSISTTSTTHIISCRAQAAGSTETTAQGQAGEAARWALALGLGQAEAWRGVK
eukprot:evm.model.NODE_34765_length_6794_cov_32.593021.2